MELIQKKANLVITLAAFVFITAIVFGIVG